MKTTRLEAFSDGVLAIIITIMVLEMKVPHGAELAALKPLIPHFFSYVLSFIYVGIYWNNHHHLLKVTKHVSAGIMWSNLNLLFWLSLIPFTTGWLGANHGGKIPTSLYAGILFVCGISYLILQNQVVRHSRDRNQIMADLQKSKKGLISMISYALAVLFAYFNPVISDILIVSVALIWFVPDKRIEKFL